MSVVGSMVGAVAVVSAVLAPGAVADDVQSKQWYLDAMHAEEMWKVSTGEGVKVAVLDSGVNPETSSLKGQVLADEVPKSVAYHATKDYGGHGTTMAELIAGTGAGGGLKGLAPGAKIVPYRVVLSQLKDKAEKAKTPEAAEAIRAAADTDAKIISMSFAGPVHDDEEEAAIKYAVSRGKLLIAGTGNDGESDVDYVGYPAAYPNVVGVAAVDEDGKVADFSSHGNYVDLGAPGEDLPMWCDNTFRAYCDNGGGTSSATALTSASAALVWSAHPGWTANQVLRVLIDTASRKWAKDDPSTYLGYGLIRPRVVLADSGIDAGAAGTDPLAKENEAGATGASPSASASKGAQSSDEGSGETAAAGADSGSSGGTLWTILGAAAVAMIGGATFAVIRARRRG
ncbi:S8 family serine peptidase [Streptomyces sp. NPDC059785]|uniref:S8 family serine peptidase n=1 Tax=Streptomyces sp. NPDC059785 TaxID=3346945 RepID=UPI00364AB292